MQISNLQTDLTFLGVSNASFIRSLYVSYAQNPSSVDQSWASFFESLGDPTPLILQEASRASWVPFLTGGQQTEKKSAVQEFASSSFSSVSSLGEGHEKAVPQQVLDSIRALMMVRAYRVRGHLAARLDPLGLEKKALQTELAPAFYGLSHNDPQRKIYMDGVLGFSWATVPEIVMKLHETYADTLGIEFMHLQDPEKKAWIQERVENHRCSFEATAQKELLFNLLRAECLEQYLALKYPGAKRFGLEGSESIIPALSTCLKFSARHGVKEVVLGMAHRGRLNVLANIMGKPCRVIFSQFQGKSGYPDDVQGSGDVKYHLGASGETLVEGHKIYLSLTANPSHLESVNPIVMGKVRAKQNQMNEGGRHQVMGILIHGDAAFAGQGLVSETLLLSHLEGYTTGGTFHIIINNQIGFTTSPVYSRSSVYPSDVAKTIQAPIFHVNGDDLEKVAWAIQVAAEYRAHFQEDVVVDIFCYRRHGHNEIDDPSFTQPLMYKAIRSHPLISKVYCAKLLQEGTLTPHDLKTLQDRIQETLDEEFKAAQTYQSQKEDWLENAWVPLPTGEDILPSPDTGVASKNLRAVLTALTTLPEDFSLHPKLVRFLEAKTKVLETGENVDWSTAEALAFGTLLQEGTPVRLSGQDSRRGTFSQRHAVFIDQENGQNYISLNHISGSKPLFEVIDSPLSEAAVLGFEVGYTLADSQTLVLWEAQFGDFANGAQIIIDQFIASGEAKWLRMSGLVMLLPHGYEGQGPEHSSARLERYLQLCAENNMQVVNCSTPANYFHVVRRHIKHSFRKPLILLTPKSLLRHPLALSSLKEMKTGTTFRPLLPDSSPRIFSKKKVKRVILCSGKIYYDLWEAREKQNNPSIALIRVEQLYPFPSDLLREVLADYPNAQIIWCQEEPENMGAWHFMDRRIEGVLKSLGRIKERPLYVGRPESAATATGFIGRHTQEQTKLIEEALQVP